MKKIIGILLLIIVTSCDSENAIDCFQSAGSSRVKEYDLSGFDKITVFERAQLFISEGDYSVRLETGENLINDIDIKILDNRLVIKNNNACNLIRDYGITKVFVSAPNLTEIRNSSGLKIISENRLNYPNLTLLSEDLEAEDAFYIDGDFELNLNVENLTITQNGLSNFFLSGNITNLDLNFLFGDARFEGRNLTVENADVYHRGTNDIIINPQNELTGTLLSTGNMVVVNTPLLLDVEQLYTGQVIIED
ncbi:head GIN domain-containing protein [uncultured Winogradskyella sp.]|uniref:head GIN domain-containing protein n=1 Tax=uncultured Winogradskyella sp. TaxID=395353 RepID=UPI0026223AC3|nr:head GIN domain-containing protein [uncultured Winogradskyella sp.]